MAFKKQRLPSARQELEWFCQTYGREANTEVNKWLDELVRAASEGKPVTSLGVEDLYDFIDEAINSEEEATDAWSYSVAKFKSSGFADKARAILAFLKTRRPPWEIRFATRTFDCLGGVLVEVLVAMKWTVQRRRSSLSSSSRTSRNDRRARQYASVLCQGDLGGSLRFRSA